MANSETGMIRNVAVAGHGKAGKTTLVEAMLYSTKAIDRLGKVEDGSTTTDHEPEEIAKQMSLTSALAHCTHNGTKFTIIDTPGFINFIEDARGCMRAVDGALIMVSAISGIKGETEKVWGYANSFGLPRMIVVNKLDKEAADFQAALQSIKNILKYEPAAVNIPINEGEGMTGIIDLIGMKAHVSDGNGGTKEAAIPADMADRAKQMRAIMMERAAECDDKLTDKYIEKGELTQEEILHGLKCGTRNGGIVPVACCIPNKGIGVTQLLDAMALCLPSPTDAIIAHPITATNMADNSEIVLKPEESEPFSAYVFKTVADPFAGKLSMFRVFSGTIKADSTVYNSSTDTKERVGQILRMQGKKSDPAGSLGPGEIGVVAKLKNTNTGDTLTTEGSKIAFERVKFAEPLISYAIAPKNKGDEDKVSVALHRILDEDPTLRFTRDEEAKDMLLAGMGQSHLEVTLEKLKRKFGVEVVMHAPKIPYRETISAKATAQGRYKKQSGGKGQFGDCHITIEPRPRGAGYEFEDNIVGGAIPRNFIPAVDKGIQEAMKAGPFAGFNMVDVKVSLFDGSYHAVDSSEMAFKIAGSMALKKALETAKPVVLEPIMKVDITTPDEYLGTVIGDLNGRRGKVQGMDQVAGTTNQKVIAMVPMAEMLTYANVLQSMTAGRGVYTMEFAQYEELPTHLTQKLLDEKEKNDKGEKEH